MGGAHSDTFNSAPLPRTQVLPATGPPTSPTLCELNEDVLWKITDYLPDADVYNLTLTCKSLSYIATHGYVYRHRWNNKTLHVKGNAQRDVAKAVIVTRGGLLRTLRISNVAAWSVDDVVTVINALNSLANLTLSYDPHGIVVPGVLRELAGMGDNNDSGSCALSSLFLRRVCVPQHIVAQVIEKVALTKFGVSECEWFDAAAYQQLIAARRAGPHPDCRLEFEVGKGVLPFPKKCDSYTRQREPFGASGWLSEYPIVFTRAKFLQWGDIAGAEIIHIPRGFVWALQDDKPSIMGPNTKRVHLDNMTEIGVVEFLARGAGGLEELVCSSVYRGFFSVAHRSLPGLMPTLVKLDVARVASNADSDRTKSMTQTFDCSEPVVCSDLREFAIVNFTWSKTTSAVLASLPELRVLQVHVPLEQSSVALEHPKLEELDIIVDVSEGEVVVNAPRLRVLTNYRHVVTILSSPPLESVTYKNLVGGTGYISSAVLDSQVLRRFKAEDAKFDEWRVSSAELEYVSLNRTICEQRRPVYLPCSLDFLTELHIGWDCPSVLDLSRVPSLRVFTASNTDLKRLALNAPVLRVLRMRYCSRFQELDLNAPHLEKVQLIATGISPEMQSLRDSLARSPKLVYVKIWEPWNVAEVDPPPVDIAATFLEAIPAVRVLKLQSRLVDNSFLEALPEFVPVLRSLDIRGNDVTVSAVFRLLESRPEIDHVSATAPYYHLQPVYNRWIKERLKNRSLEPPAEIRGDSEM